MKTPSIAIEKLRRLQTLNPDGRYCITLTQSGRYRVVDALDLDENDKTAIHIDDDKLQNGFVYVEAERIAGNYAGW